MTQEDFAPRAVLIDGWTSAANTQHPLNDVLREVSMLKKLNSGLAKTSAIDDLIADVFAMIWTSIGPSLEPAPPVTLLPLQPVVLSTPVSQSIPQQRDEKMSLMHLMNLDGAIDRRSTPVSTPPVTPITSFVNSNGLQIGEPVAAAKPRIRLISRREIIKRATDAASTKPAASTATNATPLKTLPRPIDPNIRVVIPARGSSGAGPPESPGPTIENEMAPASPASSGGNSIHDSADNESEPSDAGDGDDEMGEPDEDTEMDDGDADADADDMEPNVDTDPDNGADTGLEKHLGRQPNGVTEPVLRKNLEVPRTTPTDHGYTGNDGENDGVEVNGQES